MIKVQKNDSGQWEVASIASQKDVPTGYAEFLIRVLNNLEKLFSAAHSACEFEFICTLLGIRSMQDAGWDPYETTIKAISEVLSICNNTDNLEAQKHLQLWLYLHIMEASGPYEILANLIGIVEGEQFNTNNSPLKKNGWFWSPGEKIAEISKQADKISMGPEVSFLV